MLNQILNWIIFRQNSYIQLIQIEYRLTRSTNLKNLVVHRLDDDNVDDDDDHDVDDDDNDNDDEDDDHDTDDEAPQEAAKSL